LHTEFEPVHVNAQKYRKEFSKAYLDEVEAAVKRLAPNAPFFKDVEAQDYRETPQSGGRFFSPRRHRVFCCRRPFNDGILCLATNQAGKPYPASHDYRCKSFGKTSI
jgi:hypothetical protein